MSRFKSSFKSIREIHDAFDRKELSPVELTQSYLESIQKSHHNAYITICSERALKQARDAEATLAKAGRVPREEFPLFGIPLGIKDVLAIEGVKMTCASRMLENYVPPYTATAVARLEKAGAITIGKLNMDEFAMGGSNENSAFGPVQHPTHPDRVPGGSSGGSATATRADLCVASLGTDTGGSIRLPAHYCGIVGLKPTYGRVSRYGMVAFASSFDQIGPMTKTVEDAAVLLDAMAGFDPMDGTSSPVAKGQYAKAALIEPDWKNLRIGVPKEHFNDGIDPEITECVQKSLQWFESKGAKLVPISLPHTQYSVATYYIVAVSEASSNLARFDGVRFGYRPNADEVTDLISFYKKARSRFGQEVKRRIMLGTFALSSGYQDAYYTRACQVRRLIKQDFDNVFDKVDLIMGPVSHSVAFKRGEKSKDPLKMYLNDLLTIPANLAGLPAMSMPCGDDRDGLSIGLHLIGKHFDEERMISVAAAFEKGRA